jgi:hypothetical protein
MNIEKMALKVKFQWSLERTVERKPPLAWIITVLATY